MNSSPNGKPLRGSRQYTLWWPLLFLAPFFICFAAFNLYPILYSFITSFYQWDGIGEKVFVGLDNYRRIATADPNFVKSVLNTVKIMLLSFPLAILVGLVVATFLSGLVRGRHFFQTVNFLPYITTPVAIGLIFSFLFDWNTGSINKIATALGILDKGINWLGNPSYAPLVVALMIIWKYTGYYMALYLAGITSIPEELYEAARVDGSGMLNTFFRITLPMLKPITVFIVITSLIGGLQLFDEPNTMFTTGIGSVVGGPDRSCLTIVWNFYDISFQTTTRLGYGSAVAVVLFLIIVAVSLVGMKFMGRKGD